MHKAQPRPMPLRIYEPNIIHNPRTWFGIWTPHGWRVHEKRFGKAERFTVALSGDGKTTYVLVRKAGETGFEGQVTSTYSAATATVSVSP